MEAVLAGTSRGYPAGVVNTPGRSLDKDGSREYFRLLRSARLIALAAGLLLALCAPGAQAATKTLAKSAQSGPVLAGAKVLYGVDTGTGSGSGSDAGVDLRSVTVSGGRPSTLYRFKSPSSAVDTNELSGLDADGSRWATVRTTTTTTGDGPDTDSAPSGGDLVAGTIGKRPSRLLSSFGKSAATCSPRRYDDPRDVAIVDGGVAAGVAPNGCDESAIVLLLGKKVVRLKGRTPRGGGRWLAYADGKAVVVYDVKLRRESYRVTGETGESPVVFDPQGDGKLVVWWDKTPGDAHRLAWYSKAENRAHDLGVTPDELGTANFGTHVSMAADTIVLPITSGGGTPSESRTLFALDLTGKRTKIDDVRGASPLTGLDFDGRRVAWIDFAGVRVAALPAR